jgi:hypothetical protein
MRLLVACKPEGNAVSSSVPVRVLELEIQRYQPQMCSSKVLDLLLTHKSTSHCRQQYNDANVVAMDEAALGIMRGEQHTTHKIPCKVQGALLKPMSKVQGPSYMAGPMI